MRITLLVLSIILFVCGFVVVVHAPHLWPVGLELIFLGIILIIGVGFERARYRARNAGSSDAWVATGERFVDPTTGQTTEVYYNPKTGERSYRASSPE